MKLVGTLSKALGGGRTILSASQRAGRSGGREENDTFYHHSHSQAENYRPKRGLFIPPESAAPTRSFPRTRQSHDDDAKRAGLPDAPTRRVQAKHCVGLIHAGDGRVLKLLFSGPDVSCCLGRGRGEGEGEGNGGDYTTFPPVGPLTQ